MTDGSSVAGRQEENCGSESEEPPSSQAELLMGTRTTWR